MSFDRWDNVSAMTVWGWKNYESHSKQSDYSRRYVSHKTLIEREREKDRPPTEFISDRITAVNVHEEL